MKLPRILFVCAALTVTAAGVRAEDWTTSDGKVYKDVHVVKLEPDAVTIIHHDGGALVPLAQLPAPLRQRFGYDPDKAKAAAEQRAKTDGESTVAMNVERLQAKKLADEKEAKYKAEKKAIDDKKAAAAAAEPPDNPLHVEQFGLATPPDSSHHNVGQALAPDDPKLKVAAQPTSR